MGIQKDKTEQEQNLKTQMREFSYNSNKQNHIQAEKTKQRVTWSDLDQIAKFLSTHVKKIGTWNQISPKPTSKTSELTDRNLPNQPHQLLDHDQGPLQLQIRQTDLMFLYVYIDNVQKKKQEGIYTERVGDSEI